MQSPAAASLHLFDGRFPLGVAVGLTFSSVELWGQAVLGSHPDGVADSV